MAEVDNHLDKNFVKHLITQNLYINKNSVDSQVKRILSENTVTQTETIKAWLLRIISVIDLTTLSGDDTRSNIVNICRKAANPLNAKLIQKLNIDDEITTAAVCVYSLRVADAYDIINMMGLRGFVEIASVATGFPSGLCPFDIKLQEIKYAVSKGATEIDVVINRSLVLSGKWETLFDELVLMRDACGEAHMKVILGVGELGSYENVYRASMVAMAAGADFIKTSTGKETVNATLPVGLVMCRAIRDFYLRTGIKVGLKPAGGIKTTKDAISWLILVYTELGPEWTTPQLFRIGASGLLDAVKEHLDKCSVTKSHDTDNYQSMVKQFS